jgi:hypothetical protein
MFEIMGRQDRNKASQDALFFYWHGNPAYCPVVLLPCQFCRVRLAYAQMPARLGAAAGMNQVQITVSS